MCWGVTRSDVTCVYFQPIHVNVDTTKHISPQKHTQDKLKICAHCSSHAQSLACTIKYHWEKQMKQLTKFWTLGPMPCSCRLTVSLAVFLVWSVDDKCGHMYVCTHTQQHSLIHAIANVHRGWLWLGKTGWLNRDKVCVSLGKTSGNGGVGVGGTRDRKSYRDTEKFSHGH